MKPVKCVKGHYFDSDRFERCPQCGSKRADGLESTSKATPQTESQYKKDNTNKTVGVFDRSGNIVEKLFPAKKTTSDTDTNAIPPAVKKPAETAPAPAPVTQVSNQEENNTNDSLLNEIKKVSKDNEGKTVGFFNIDKKADETSVSSVPSEPVVGWLVCVKGTHFGESFAFYSGRNSIGRNAENKVSLLRDNTVSREKHAWIIYEPKKKQFFVQPGDSSGLVYINDEMISSLTEIKPYEKIELGGALLMFVPLCGENFDWGNYNKE